MRSTIRLKVFPGARENSLVAHGDEFVIRVTAPAERGKANAAALALLADHLGVAKSSLTIIQGATARKKLVVID